MELFQLKNLNETQQQAAKATEGPVLVSAGAGSGKTTVLTDRIAHLVVNKGVNPYNILAITFTNKAAKEMLERTKKMKEEMQGIWISTFHSMCARILRRDIDKLGYQKAFSIYSDTDSGGLIDQIIQEKNLLEEKKDLKKTLMFHISNCKNNNLTLAQYYENNKTTDDIDKIMEIFSEYENRMKTANALDFDDLLTKAYKLLKEYPEILEHYSNRFRYIMVDEFQDTNTIQYEIVALLASKHRNLFVVGDEDQCIYTWRGASYKNISRFQKEFSPKLFKLEINYRSTSNILEVANKLIKHNTSRIEKSLQSNKGKGLSPEYYTSYSERDEADYVALKIDFLTREKGYSYKDFAILMRVNALSFHFEQNFLAHNIPHRIFGGFKFFERAEIKNVTSYLKLFANPNDEMAFLRVINAPKRGLGKVAIENLRELSLKLDKSLLETVLEIQMHDFTPSSKSKFYEFANTFNKLKKQRESLSLGEFANAVVSNFEIKQMYNISLEEEMNKVLNIETLLTNMIEYSETNPSLTLEDYLESITLISDIDDMDESNSVTIATVHSAKGLEFKVVFVVGAEEGIFPSSRAFGSNYQIEEERRLMYVAVTRAKERLYITNTRSRFLHGRTNISIQSRFIKELGMERKIENKVSQDNFALKSSYDFDISLFKSNNNIGAEQKPKKDISIYQAGQTVEHTRFGKGKVLSVSGDEAEISFEVAGIKTLILSLAPLTIIKE